MKATRVRKVTEEEIFEYELQVNPPEHIMMVGYQTLHTQTPTEALKFKEKQEVIWGYIDCIDNWYEFDGKEWTYYEKPALAKQPYQWRFLYKEVQDKVPRESQPRIITNYYDGTYQIDKDGSLGGIKTPLLILLDERETELYNQVGGSLCEVYKVKGKPLGIRGYKSWVFNPDLWYITDINSEENRGVVYQEIKRIISNEPGIEFIRFITELNQGETSPKRLCEAWVPMEILYKGEKYEAILTWTNSD